jgi:hypothetical protein
MKRIIFFVSLATILVGCAPKEQSAKVYGRYVPERKDDFAWENEYAAFRMYGAALKPENPSNGVDLWLKNSPALVVDTMYGRELRDHRPYHINYDGNLDCYKVAHTCGAGGLVVLTADGEGTNGESFRTWIGGPYDRWQILEQTPERFVFRLEYDSLLVAGQIFRESLTITAEAGQLQNKAEVVLTSDQQSAISSQLLVGGGIYMHDTVDYYLTIPEAGYVFYEEDALSDKQAAQMNYEYNGSTSQGRVQISVKTPGATLVDIVGGNLVAVKPYQLGDTLTYYFGATWSEWNKNH